MSPRRNWLFFIILGLFLVVPSLANAAGFKPIKFGAYASVVKDPLISLVGVGPTITLLDALRVQAGFGALRALTVLFGRMTGFYHINIYNYGASAKLRVPGLKYSPLFGFDWSKQYRGSDNLDTFIAPSVGLEVRSNDKFYVDFGIFIPYKRENKKWVMKEASILFDEKTTTPVILYVSAGVDFI